jgi:predicted sulfurtransferase
VSLLLFYAYVVPAWTPSQRGAAVDFCKRALSSRGCAGRLRVALEGFNGTLSGSAAGLRGFCDALREYDRASFGGVDFKLVDGLPANKAFRELKVMPVAELVTYGFGRGDAPAGAGGEHVAPARWNALAAQPGAVIVDVRNANETAIGRFAPPAGGATLLDPRMRRSTEFPDWVEANLPALRAAPTVMMYCTAGIRCERASALLKQRGLDNVVQLDGGVHRYLDAFPDDGGLWAGANYTFDKRFSHGAARRDVVGACGRCDKPWERYQAGAKCAECKMEALLCRECERAERAAKGGKAAAAAAAAAAAPAPPARRILCWLCAENARRMSEGGAAAAEARAAARRAAAFAASGGGFDGEGGGGHAARET